MSLDQLLVDSQRDLIAAQAERIKLLREALQQFVNGVEMGLIDSPADDILANVTSRAKAALANGKAL